MWSRLLWTHHSPLHRLHFVDHNGLPNIVEQVLWPVLIFCIRLLSNFDFTPFTSLPGSKIDFRLTRWFPPDASILLEPPHPAWHLSRWHPKPAAISVMSIRIWLASSKPSRTLYTIHYAPSSWENVVQNAPIATQSVHSAITSANVKRENVPYLAVASTRRPWHTCKSARQPSAWFVPLLGQNSWWTQLLKCSRK